MARHAWPTGQPLRKAPRTCTNCGMTVTLIKSVRESLTQGVYWELGDQSLIVPSLRDVPGCVSPDANTAPVRPLTVGEAIIALVPGAKGAGVKP